MAVATDRLAVLRLPGHVPYGEALALQRAAHAARRAGSGPDTLFLLELSPRRRSAPGASRSCARIGGAGSPSTGRASSWRTLCST